MQQERKKKDKIIIRHTENNKQNDNNRYFHICNYFKYKYIKSPTQKMYNGSMYIQQDSTICYLQEPGFKYKDIYRQKVKAWGKKMV